MVRKDAWKDFNFFEFTKARFMAQDVIYPGEGSWRRLFGLVLYRILHFLDLATVSFSQVGDVSCYYDFKYVLGPLLFSSFWDPYKENIRILDVVPEVSNCAHFFSFFFLNINLCNWRLIILQFCIGFAIHQHHSFFLFRTSNFY